MSLFIPPVSLDWINVSFDVLNALYLSPWISSFVATWKQTQSECLPQGSGQRTILTGLSISRKHDHLISEVILSKELWYPQSVQRPALPLLFLNHRGVWTAGKIVMKLLFKRTGFKWDATPDHSRYVVKPLKAKTIQFRFRRSLFWMCLRRGRDRDKSDTVNCCSHNLTTSSKPVPNSVWLFSQGGGLFL